MRAYCSRSDKPKQLGGFLRGIVHQGNRIAIAALTIIGLAMDGYQRADMFFGISVILRLKTLKL